MRYFRMFIRLNGCFSSRLMQKGTIRGFKHCSKTSLIIVSKLCQVCPICGLSLEASGSIVPPFVLLNSPVFSAHSSPLSIVVCSRDGSGRLEDNLHCGVTDSQGAVYHYSNLGLLKSSIGWEESLALELRNCFSEENLKCFSLAAWNERLCEAINSRTWKHDKYVEGLNDCFTFVCSFLSFWNESLNDRLILANILTEKLLNPYLKFSRVKEKFERCDFIIKNEWKSKIAR